MHADEPIGLERQSLIAYIWGQKKHLWLYAFFRVISILAITPFPLITQRIVDQSVANRDLNEVWYYTGISLALLVVHLVSMKVAVRFLAVDVQLILRELRSRLFHKLNFMHFRFLDSVQTGRLLSKYTFDTNNIEFTLILIVTAVLPELFRSFLLIAMLTYINAWLLLIVAVCVPIFAIVRHYYFKPIEASNHAVRLAREDMAGQANEFISAIKLVRGYGQEKQARQQMDLLSDAYSDERVDQMRLNQGLGYILFTAVSALSIVAVAACAWLVIEDKLTLGAMVALVASLPICFQPIFMITQFSMQYLLGAESFRSIKELMDSGYVEAWQGTQLVGEVAGQIEFNHVSFAYDERTPEVIRDSSTTIKAGEHVAFVGPSGSGKSTLVSLMLGFYAATEGEIHVDGVPQNAIDIRQFRLNCAIVMQDNLLLSGTLLDNIRFGRPSASIEEVHEAALNANALEFIEELPDGFDTKVGERGVSLSGGQRQRIAIARALLRNPKVLILDEATSALDYESERLVQEAFERLAQGRTTITIAHRLSTIRNADRIIVLKKGKKVSEGTWDELASQEGAFMDLLNAQS
jgi:ABC-type multidrug transport system fused ATPase/permease subunit